LGEAAVQMTDYVETVRDFMVDYFLIDDSTSFTEATSFFESGIVDSTGILELVSFIEETFGIVLQDEEFIPENLDSLSQIARFLHRKLNSGNS
jgi:acyl carrier protein